jgi:regulatory protein
MMVTAIEPAPKRRGRVEIFVDGVAALEMRRDSAAKHQLRPGRAIERAEIEAIVAAEQRREAIGIATAMLARRPRSEREIQRRLAQGKLPAVVIDETVAKLRDARLLDDAEFARIFAESRDRLSPRGNRLVTRELGALGVDAATAAVAVSAISEEDAAYRAATRRMKSLERLDYAAFRSRLSGQLQRRGFGWQITRATVDRVWRELGGVPDSGDTFAE